MIFLIHGPPGAGKTTLSNQLSEKFGLPHISSDRISEWLSETAQSCDGASARFISCAGYELMFRIASELSKGLGSFIFEGCINPEFGGIRLLNAINAQNHEICEIFLKASNEILLKRYSDRAGSSSRHSAHGEENSRTEELRKHLDSVNYRPTGVGKYLIEIDNGENPNNTFQIVVERLDGIFPAERIKDRKLNSGDDKQ